MDDAAGIFFLRQHPHQIHQHIFQSQGLQPILDRRSQLPCHPGSIKGVDAAQQHLACNLLQALPPAPVLKVVHHEARGILLPEHLHDIFSAQEVLAGKLHNGIHDAGPVAPQDIRAIGNAQRTAEDGCHGKPVCQTANSSRQEAVVEQTCPKTSLYAQSPQEASCTEAQGKISLIFLLHQILCPKSFR